jgi:hypothetical protein
MAFFAKYFVPCSDKNEKKTTNKSRFPIQNPHGHVKLKTAWGVGFFTTLSFPRM